MDGDNLKLKYIIKEGYSYTNETVQSSSILVVQIIVKNAMVFILEEALTVFK